MDVLSPSWFEEVLEMQPNNFFIDQCETMVDPYDDDIIMSAEIGDGFQISLSPENSNSSSSTLIPRCSSTTTLCVFSSDKQQLPPPPPIKTIERPKKQRKTYNKRNLDRQSTSTPIILDFGSKSSQSVVTNNNNSATENNNDVAKSGQKRVRPLSQTYDHIVAERKRREQLSQRFIALSAIVPGLKKMDKTSVLGDAIKYLKQLQEKVKILEEQNAQKTMESVVLVTKSRISTEDELSSTENDAQNNNNENQSDSNNHLPEIEARFSDKSVLLRIHCEKRRGVLVNILAEIEKMNLIILNTNTSSFGTLALDVTIITEMDKGFDMTLKDIVRNLQSVLRRI